MLFFNKACELVSAVARVWTLLLATGLFGVVIATVVLRGTAGWVPSWSEEVPRYLMIWVGFMSAAVAVDRKDHIALDIVYEAVRGVPRLLLHSAVNLVIIAFGLIMLIYGIRFVQDFGGDLMESIPYRNYWYYTSLPISGGLVILFALRDLLNLWLSPQLRTERVDLDATAAPT